MNAPEFDFDEVFGDDYLYFYGPALEESSDADAALIWRLLDVGAAGEILDLACGHGRIANRLAGLGATVTGLDATPVFLERAAADAAARGVTVDYVQGDMRSLPWGDATFECVICWFTSFGYFDDHDNRRVLAEVRRVLRPGGRLLLENNNLAGVLGRWLPSVVFERDGDLAIDRAQFDPTTGRARTERTVIRDGQVRTFVFSVRMFIAVELRAWLLEAGFSDVAFFDERGEPLTSGARRMVTIATA